MRAIHNYVRSLRKTFPELKPPKEANFCAAEFDLDENKTKEEIEKNNYFAEINVADEKRKQAQYNPYIQSVVNVLNRFKINFNKFVY